MKTFLHKLEEKLADSALLEMGVDIYEAARQRSRKGEETLEENLVEVAFAEEADYDQIHAAILQDHEDSRDVAHPDDCQYGDNDYCYV